MCAGRGKPGLDPDSALQRAKTPRNPEKVTAPGEPCRGRPELTGIPAGLGRWDPRGSRWEAVTEMMPLARYFVFVGGALMALLFAFDFFSPKAVADIGIHSAGPRRQVDPAHPFRAEVARAHRVRHHPADHRSEGQAQTAQAALPGPAPAPEITADGPRARDLCPVRSGRAEEARGHRAEEAQGRQGLRSADARSPAPDSSAPAPGRLKPAISDRSKAAHRAAFLVCARAVAGERRCRRCNALPVDTGPSMARRRTRRRSQPAGGNIPNRSPPTFTSRCRRAWS